MSTKVNTNITDSNTPTIHIHINIVPPSLVLKLQPNPTSSQYSALT